MVTPQKGDSARAAVTPTRGYVPRCIRCIGLAIFDRFAG
jgi:hypothetical protein